MTRLHRTSRTSRPAGLADPRQELDLFQPYCSGTMLVLERDPTPCWPRLERCTAGLPAHRYEVTAHIDNVPRGRAATFGMVSSARSNTGLVLPIRVSVDEFLAIMCGRRGCGR
jgi:hypothetical protein